MPQLFTNNARALLASGISDTATSLTVESTRADFFPTANTGTGSVPSSSNWFKATIQDSSGNVEIVYVRTRTAGSGVFSNVIRAQEGTTARSFSAGSVVGLRLTALDVQQSINVLSNNNVFSGSNTFGGAVTFSQTATFAQTIVGSINGNAATVTNGVYTTGTQTIGGNKTFSDTVLFQDNQHFIALTSGNAIHNLDTNDYWNFARSTNLLSLVLGGVARATFAGNGNFTASGNISSGGSISSTSDITSGGDITASGDITALSDIRLKRDLHVIPHALDKVRRLTGYTYTRIDTGARQTGLVAQDVERVQPEAVVRGEHLSVAYGNLVGLLVEAIKEIDAEVSKLKGA